MGEAKVLSTTTRASVPLASWATAAMSVICIMGLVGVSTQIIRVCSFMAACTASRSLKSTKWKVMP